MTYRHQNSRKSNFATEPSISSRMGMRSRSGFHRTTAMFLSSSGTPETPCHGDHALVHDAAHGWSAMSTSVGAPLGRVACRSSGGCAGRALPCRLAAAAITRTLPEGSAGTSPRSRSAQRPPCLLSDTLYLIVYTAHGDKSRGRVPPGCG